MQRFIRTKVGYIPPSRQDGNILAGQKVLVTLVKLASGDILVKELRKGWAPLPAPLPIYVRGQYVLRRK